MRVAASGGAPIAVTALDAARQETGHLNPWLLRDGRHFSTCGTRVPGNSGLWVGSLDVALTRNRVRAWWRRCKAPSWRPVPAMSRITCCSPATVRWSHKRST